MKRPALVRSRGFHYVGRLRYRTRLLVPLNDRKDVKGEWQGIASQETMVRFGDEAFKGLFDQARLGLSAGVRPWDHVQVTGGYQFQYLVRPDNVRRESNHTLMLGVAVRVPRRACTTCAPCESSASCARGTCRNIGRLASTPSVRLWVFLMAGERAGAVQSSQPGGSVA